MGNETAGLQTGPPVEAPIRAVLQMILGHHITAVVAAIARFDIPDQLSSGPSTATRLAQATGVDQSGLLRLLRAAASLGLLDELADETFAINSMSECLRRGSHSLREIALAANEPIHWRTAAHLTEAVAKNHTIVSDVVGMDAWEYRDAHPEGRLATSDRLIDIEAAVLPALQREVDLESCRRIVAIGDGQCRLLPALLRLAPRATGVIFDRPPVVDHARILINAAGLGDRVTVVGGDFLQRVPAGGDLYVIKGVLHDCDDDSASWLLDSCYMAALPHSTLVAFEGFLPTASAHDPVARLIDINLLLTVNGRERTIEEFEELFANAGYELTRAEPLPAVAFRPFVMLQGAPVLIMARILIVGAGPAGLAVAAVLRRRGVPATLLERGEAVGANWRHRYDGLRLNTARWLSALPGRAIPRSAGRWVSRDDYVAYLERYADLNHLDVMTRVEVDRVVAGRGTGSDRWKLHTSKGELDAAAVVVASGPFDQPVVPPWPGLDRYRGAVAHAATYRNPAPYRGQHVLVVGGGASGLEIALLLAEGGAGRVDLSVRSCTNLFPRQVGPYPLTPLPVTRLAPAWLLDLAGAGTHRLLGPGWPAPLPRPAAKLGTALYRDGTEPVVADGIVSALRAGTVNLLPAVADFTATTVRLVDGGVVQPDTVLAATGYRSRLQTLAAELDVFGENGQLVRGDGGPCPGAPGVAFIGFQAGVTGRLPQMPSQARRAARTVVAITSR